MEPYSFRSLACFMSSGLTPSESPHTIDLMAVVR